MNRMGGSTSSVEDAFNWIVRLYGRLLSLVLRHSFVTLLVLLTTIGLNVYLFDPRAQGILSRSRTTDA